VSSKDLEILIRTKKVLVLVNILDVLASEYLGFVIWAIVSLVLIYCLVFNLLDSWCLELIVKLIINGYLLFMIVGVVYTILECYM
jgi:membrane protein DedA with SNARE-associated domain